MEAAPDTVLPAGKAGSREPCKFQREQQNEQKREPEIGDGDANLRDAHDDRVAGLAAIGRGIDANGDRNHDRDRHGEESQGQCHQDAGSE
ncbi:hypothetical protein D3C71_2092050 [compost metagenome]